MWKTIYNLEKRFGPKNQFIYNNPKDLELFLCFSIINCLEYKQRGFSKRHQHPEPQSLVCRDRPNTLVTCSYSYVAPFLNCDSSISTNGKYLFN